MIELMDVAQAIFPFLLPLLGSAGAAGAAGAGAAGAAGVGAAGAAGAAGVGAAGAAGAAAPIVGGAWGPATTVTPSMFPGAPMGLDKISMPFSQGLDGSLSGLSPQWANGMKQGAKGLMQMQEAKQKSQPTAPAAPEQPRGAFAERRPMGVGPIRAKQWWSTARPSRRDDWMV